MKRIFVSSLVILLGVATLVIPNFSSYLDTSTLLFNLSTFLADHPEFTCPVGVIAILVGITYFALIVLDRIRTNTAFVIQKADVDDYGDIDIHFPELVIGNRDELVYESFITLEEHSKSVITLEKKKVRRFYDEIPAKKRIAFLAIAPMPVLVYSGFVVANTGRKVSYYHWDRDKNKAVKLKSFGGRQLLKEDESINANSNEHVVCISTSYPIDKKLVNEQFVGINISYYKTNNLGYNSIKTTNSLNSVADSVRDVVSTLPSGSRVHLLLACSAELCFAIGQKLNSPALPLISVYNFCKKKKNEKPWDWSIDLN